MTSAWRVTSPPIDSTSGGSPLSHDRPATEMWKSDGRRVARSCAVVALEQDRLAPRHGVGPADHAATGREHVLAVAGGVDERVGRVSIGMRVTGS
jgi:hypothetical protein